MKMKKDLFDQIRDNQHKLDEQPSRHVWDRLEDKLDAHQTKKTTSIYRKLAVAAALVALVAVTAVIGLFNNQPNYYAEASSKQMANNKPMKFEDLVHSDAYDNEMFRVVEVTHRAANRATNPINEGSRGQKLYAKVITENNTSLIADVSQKVTVTTATNNPLAFAEREKNYKPSAKKQLKKTSADSNKETLIKNKDVASTSQLTDVTADIEETTTTIGTTNTSSVTFAEDAAIMEENYAYEEDGQILEMSDMEPPAANPDLQMGQYNEHDIYEEEDIEIANSRIMEDQLETPLKSEAPEVITHVEMKKAKEKTRSSAFASKKNKASASGMVSPSSSVASHATAEMMNEFNWLLGKWEGTVENIPSYEEWTRISSNVIKGMGTITVSSVISFTEEMTIEYSENNIYFSTTFPDHNTPVKFKLKTVTEQGAIFENMTMSFPQQILIQVTAVGLTTIMQNKTQVSLNEEQRDYYQIRNSIINNQTMRTLKKID